MWPTNAVSINEAIGSAAKATAAGKAMESISIPSSSNLNQPILKFGRREEGLGGEV